MATTRLTMATPRLTMATPNSPSRGVNDSPTHQVFKLSKANSPTRRVGESLTLRLVAKFAAGVVDTGGNFVVDSDSKFAAGIVDTGGKFCHRCQQHYRNWCQNLPQGPLIPAANLPLVSLKLVVHLDLQISP
jgi:hypothetical protein